MKTTFRSTILCISSLFIPAQLLLAQPGSGIRLGPHTVLVPEYSFTLNYNDNANLRRRALSQTDEGLDRSDSDIFFGNEVSLFLSHFAGNSRYNLRTWYGREDYDDFSDLDGERYGVNAGWFWARPTGETTLKANLSYQYAVDQAQSGDDFAEDPDIADEVENVSERVERDILKFTARASQALMTDVDGVFIFSYDETNYQDDRFNDRARFEYIGELNYRFSDKTTPYLRGGVALDDDEGFDGYAEKPFVLVGARYNPTPKLRMDLGVGYERYVRTPFVFEPNVAEQRFDRVPGDELTNSHTKLHLTVNYAATDKSRFTLRLRNGYNSVASPGNTSREELAASLGYRHQTTNNFSQTVSVSWREDDYLSPIPSRVGMVDEKKETLRYTYAANYQTVQNWLSLFGRISYEDGSSRIPGDDYTETAVTLGARLRY